MLDFVTPLSELKAQDPNSLQFESRPLTMQEILDQSYAFLCKQGKRSYDENMRVCRYRNADGSKCAVGYFMTDQEYSPEFETKTMYSGDISIPFLLSHVSREFLEKLQLAHDTISPGIFHSSLKSNFLKLAEEFNLTLHAQK